MQIYAFSGKIGSGKNFVSENIFLPLMPSQPTLVMALADHFKVDACSKDGIPYEKVFINKDEQTRKILQLRGTEEGRNKYGHDIWVRTLDTWMKVYEDRGIKRIIITDVRFKNEVDWVKNKGGKVFRIISPQRTHNRMMQEATTPEQYNSIKNHLSETDLDDYMNFDYIIHNDYDNENNVFNNIRDIVISLEKKYNKVIFCDLDDTICQCNIFYEQIINEIMNQFNITDEKRQQVLDNYVYSYHQRYYDKEDFAKSLLKAVEHTQTQTLDDKTRNEIYNKGMSVFDNSSEFIHPDIPNVLSKLSQLGKLVIFTLGDHTEQMKKIVQLKLYGKYNVEIFPHKDENMFRYLKQKYKADKYVMIGDSYKRDIVPAQEADIDIVIQITAHNNIDVITVDKLDERCLNIINSV